MCFLRFIMFSLLTLHIFFCEAALRRPSYCDHQKIRTFSRVCSSVPDFVKIVDFKRTKFSPWNSKQQKMQTGTSPIDLSEFCADPERDILYRYQSAQKLTTPGPDKEKFPLFKQPWSSFNKLSVNKSMEDVFRSIGLVESVYDLGGTDSLTTLGTGFLIFRDTVLTAAHNVVLDPSDSDKITTPKSPSTIKFHLSYDSDNSDHVHTVSYYKTAKEWDLSRDNKYDFSALFFSESIQETNIKLATVKKGMALPIPLGVAGYPYWIAAQNHFGLKKVNKPLCAYVTDGELKEISDCRKRIGYNCFTASGVSGGPVLIKDWPIVVGVHTNGNLDLNRGVHYSDHMVSYLDKWVKEHETKEQSDNENKIMEMIDEISKSELEKKLLTDKLDKLKEYPLDSLKTYMSVILDFHRQ